VVEAAGAATEAEEEDLAFGNSAGLRRDAIAVGEQSPFLCRARGDRYTVRCRPHEHTASETSKDD
jgi:hypothetical protein